MKSFEQFEYEEKEQKEIEGLLTPKKVPQITIGETIIWSDINEDVGKRQWIWENYIAKGHITLLSALWKAGKSTLLRHLFLAIAEEKEFAGQPTIKSNVLVISEETKNEWFDSKEDIDPELIKNIFIKIRPLRMKPNVKQWIDFIEEVKNECLEKKIDMVVVDTLSSFWPIDNENDSAQVMKALVPLYNFTENGIAVLLIHHFRKGGGDQAQASRGSGALPGFVDNIIEFTRSEQGKQSQRVLRTYGRFDEVIPEVVIELTPEGKYITLGEPWAVSKSARLERTIGILQEVSPLSVREIFNLWSKTSPEISLRSVKRYVKELRDRNSIIVEKEEAVLSKKTAFYALNRENNELGTALLPPHRYLSPANELAPALSPANENRAGAGDRTGISAIREAIAEEKLNKEIERIESL